MIIKLVRGCSLCLFIVVGLLSFSCTPSAPTTLRVATYNIEDTRVQDLKNPDQPRLKAAASVLQELQADILLINEITYDQPGTPGFEEGDEVGSNATRFARTFLERAQQADAKALRYEVFTAPTNTGIASGYDLDRSTEVLDAIPEVPAPGPDGKPARQTAEGRTYGGDAWGFGMFPGQYGMALYVREGLTIMHDSVRTFRLLPWQAMPDALLPLQPGTDELWYEGPVGEAFRLSSKSHWDVPVRLPDGQVIHILASHPTPPAFDGEEGRNKRRNHDEIRFWGDYLDNASYIVDDNGQPGGLPAGAAFVVMGDLNADPDEGSSIDDPIGTFLLAHPRIEGAYVPSADSMGRTLFPDLDPDDTATWGLRADYVLPSSTTKVVDGGVWRRPPAFDVEVSDHFPVWIDIQVAQ
ncbi:MAG: endonuclease/exonuclease/phosphatase family protein [Bacteroidota bacterium]